MMLALRIATYTLLGTTALSMVRVLWGPSPEDRMIGLNLASSQMLAILVLVAVQFDRAIFLDVALVYALLGFVGILAVARYLERGSGP